MGRRFPTPLFGVEDAERRSEAFVSLAVETDGELGKSEFVEQARDRFRKPDGTRYSEGYLRRVVTTYVQLGVLRQTSDGNVSVWQFGRDWHAGELDFETFLWYGIKQNWAIRGRFPEGIEGLRGLNRVLRNAETPLARGDLRDRLAEEYDYEFNDGGVRGYPTLLTALGAAEETDDGYVATDLAGRYADRFRNADVFGQFERWLNREGPTVEPPSDRVKRDLMKYYAYRESGGLGKHRRLADTFREDFLAADARTADPAEPKMDRDPKYVEEERRRRELRQEIRSRFDAMTGNDLAGLSTDVLRRMADADSLDAARRVKETDGGGVSRSDLRESAADDRRRYTFPDGFSLYDWQAEAAEAWFGAAEAADATDAEHGRASDAESGIAKVVTGAGKTVMALEVIRRWLSANPDGVVTVVVPTKVLMRQWLTELVEKLNVPPEEVGWAGDGHKDGFAGDRRILVAIVNSAVKDDHLRESLGEAGNPPHLLVADECHRYTGDVFSSIFEYHRTASLGLSATPLSSTDPEERSASDRLLVSELGEIYYELTYDEGLERSLIPEFRVNYIGFELTPAERHAYERLSRKVSDAISDIESRYANRLYELDGNYARKLQVIKESTDGPTPAIGDYFRYTQERRQLVADAVARQAITLSILREVVDEEKKAIVFQERIEQLERMVAPAERRGRSPATGSVTGENERTQLYERYPRLKEVDDELERLFLSASYRPVMYHSGHRHEMWNDFAIEWFGEDGFANVMLSVKALVEGVDVPSADVGVIRVSSGSVRQRIQTLGRVLRTGGSAKRSELYVLYARDTVDENIFEKHDWEQDLANADVRHLTWETATGSIDGELREATADEIPDAGSEPSIPDADDLSKGDRYEGPRDGYRFSVDSNGDPFEDADGGRRYIEDESAKEVAEFAHQLKGGGTVIVNEANHALVVHDGRAKFAGTVEDPDSFEYRTEEETGLTDEPADFDDVF